MEDFFTSRDRRVNLFIEEKFRLLLRATKTAETSAEKLLKAIKTIDKHLRN